MVDNWFMEEVLAEIRENDVQNYSSYTDLLMAIVLWDDVYYPSNGKNWWNSMVSPVQDLLIPVDDFGEWEGRHTEHNNIVCDGAIQYLDFCNQKGFNYLPCKKRLNFLRRACSPEEVSKALMRLRQQDILTKTVRDYYLDHYNNVLELQKIQIQMPILSKYIFDEASNDISPVDFAVQLKNEKKVIEYRNFLDQLDSAVEKQDWRELRFLLQCSQDAVDSVLSVDKRKLISVSVDIFPLPQIIIHLGNIEMNLGKTLSLTINNVEALIKKYNLIFLREVTQYAINDMALW